MMLQDESVGSTEVDRKFVNLSLLLFNAGLDSLQQAIKFKSRYFTMSVISYITQILSRVLSFFLRKLLHHYAWISEQLLLIIWFKKDLPGTQHNILWNISVHSY